MKNAASRFRQKRVCSVRSSCRKSLTRRSVPDRRPRAWAASLRARRAPRRARAAAAVSSCSRRVGLMRSLDDLAAVAAVADLGLDDTAGQLGGRALAHDHAGAQHRDAVGELLRLVEVVRRQQNRLPELAQVADRLPGRAARARVEAGRRLVEEDQLRVADQREAEVETPLPGRPRACARARPPSRRARRSRSPRRHRAAARSTPANTRRLSRTVRFGYSDDDWSITPMRSRHACRSLRVGAEHLDRPVVALR